jgi:hypothetical protein
MTSLRKTKYQIIISFFYASLLAKEWITNVLYVLRVAFKTMIESDFQIIIL